MGVFLGNRRTRAVEGHQVRSRTKLALSALSIVLATPLLLAPSSGASSPSANKGLARAYATSLLTSIPIPPGAARLDVPRKKLLPVTGAPFLTNLTDVVRYYTLSSSTDVGAFTNTHFAKVQSIGSGSSDDDGYRTSQTFSTLQLCRNRHAAYCSVTYSETALSENTNELRIDVDVVWMPLHKVRIPTSGVVTLTGYGQLSLMNASSKPVEIRLSPSQVQQLRVVVAQLRTAPGGLCTEDSTLYRLSIAQPSNGVVRWSAVADECSGTLVVDSRGRRVALNDRSCTLERLIASFFTPGSAKGTKEGLKACQEIG